MHTQSGSSSALGLQESQTRAGSQVLHQGLDRKNKSCNGHMVVLEAGELGVEARADVYDEGLFVARRNSTQASRENANSLNHGLSHHTEWNKKRLLRLGPLEVLA